MNINSRDKILVLLIYALLLTGFLTVYHLKRTAAAKKVSSGISQAQQEIAAINNKLAKAEARNKALHTNPTTLSYIESLYRAANESHLIHHEVISDNNQFSREVIDRALSSTKLQISIKGDFRAVAEYIRLVSNQQQLIRITEMKITAEKDRLAGSMNLELFTLQ